MNSNLFPQCPNSIFEGQVEVYEYLLEIVKCDAFGVGSVYRFLQILKEVSVLAKIKGYCTKVYSYSFHWKIIYVLRNVLELIP